MNFDLFVSHSSEDEVFVKKLINGIEEKGFTCWVAPRNILSGERWPAAISRGLRESEVLLLIMSENSNNSMPVENEVERMFNQRKNIIPCFIEKVKLSDSLDYMLAGSHFFFFIDKDFDDAIDELSENVIRLLPDVNRQRVLDFRNKSKKSQEEELAKLEEERRKAEATALQAKLDEEFRTKQEEINKQLGEEKLRKQQEIKKELEAEQRKQQEAYERQVAVERQQKLSEKSKLSERSEPKKTPVWLFVLIAVVVVGFAIWWIAKPDDAPYDAAWEMAQEAHEKTDYERYLKKFPEAYYVLAAKDSILSLQTADAFAKCKNKTDFLNFIDSFPADKRIKFAKNKITEFETDEKRLAAEQADLDAWSKAKRTHSIKAYEKYISNNKNGAYISDAQAAIKKFKEKPKFAEPEMVYIKGGTYQMGSPASEKGRGSDEQQHTVTVSSFYIGKYEVTQKLWKDVMGSNPSNWKGDNLPVETVSWNDVQKFIKKLNAKTGKKYRLPTEAEWEYAARGGTTTPFNTGNCLSTQEANYDGNYPYQNCSKGKDRGQTITVGRFAANAYGLYDMHGNVWEWCSDWYGENYYKNSPQNNPKGSASGSYRVVRGGSWSNFAEYCRSALRSGNYPDDSYDYIGFRVVLSH